MFKKIEISSTLIVGICLIGHQLTFLASAATEKKLHCKNNNGIGNNYEFVLALPTSSLNLDDVNNQLLAIRIDPGNQGQMNKLADRLSEDNFDLEQITFVTNQIPDLEMRSQIKAQCVVNSPVDRDLTIVVFAD
ncbi:MAG: hypothetical protein ACRC11_05055 [Xenococcaceae cyanobacterium]